MDIPRFQLGDLLRQHRRRRRMTIEQLAERSRVNKATISAIERGGNYRRDTIAKLAAVMGLTVEALLSQVHLGTPEGTDPFRLRLLTLWESIAPDHRPAALSEVERVAWVSAEIQRLALQVSAHAQRDRDDADLLRRLSVEAQRLGLLAPSGKRKKTRRRHRKTA